MNTSIDDNLDGRKIEINRMEPLPLTSNENIPKSTKENVPIKFMKNAYTKLVKNIKFLATKKNENSENLENQEQPKAQNVSIYSSIISISCNFSNKSLNI